VEGLVKSYTIPSFILSSDWEKVLKTSYTIEIFSLSSHFSTHLSQVATLKVLHVLSSETSERETRPSYELVYRYFQG